MNNLAPLTLVYDADCGFCVRSLEWVKAADRAGRIQYLASRDPHVFSRFPMLREADFRHAMYAVSDSVEVFRGFFAFRRIARVVPLLRILLPLFYFPGSSRVGPNVYAWVDRHRASFGCDSVCERPGRFTPGSHD